MDTLVIIGLAAQVLVGSWSDKVPQNERGFCVTAWHEVGGKVVVTEVSHPVVTIGANPVSANFACEKHQPVIHTHPPQSCSILGVCEPDDSRVLNPRDCQPSDLDRATLEKDGSPFDIVQCGALVFTLYRPRA